MKKRRMAAVLAVIFVFSLTGCVNFQVEEKISKSGTYTGSMVACIERAALVDYVNRKMGTDNVSNVEKELRQEGYTLQTMAGKEYYVSEPEVRKSTIARLAKDNQQSAVKGTYQVWETGLYMNIKAMAYEYESSLGDVLEEDPASGVYSKEEKELLAKSYVQYSVEFDYDIVKTDQNAVIDSQNPRKATWKIPMDSRKQAPVMEAYCKSDIQVSGVKQGATYKKARKVKFGGVTSATYKGKQLKSGTSFKKNGQHTLILKAASGEQRTVTFFIDKKKPVIKGIKNKKTYKKAQLFSVSDSGSGVASIKINGKKKDPSDRHFEIRKNGMNKIVVRDRVGNTTKIKVKLVKNKKSAGK